MTARSRHALLLSLSSLLVGCASQMPPVSGFFAGNPTHLDLVGSSSLDDFNNSRTRDDSRYECIPDSSTGRAVLRCSESPGWRLYEDPPLRSGVGLYHGERWRFGADASSWSLLAGWRGDRLGAVGWVTPPGSMGFGMRCTGGFDRGLTGGLALAQHASPFSRLSLGSFQYLGRIPHLRTWRQESTAPDKLWAYPELGIGAWIRLTGEEQIAFEGRIGRDLDEGVWRPTLTVSVGFGGGRGKPPEP